MISKYENDRRLKVFRKHGTSLKAAEQIGMSHSGFFDWAVSRGLVKNKGSRRHVPRVVIHRRKKEDKRRRKILRQHGNYADAARAIGISKQAFWTWAKSCGIQKGRSEQKNKDSVREVIRRIDAVRGNRSCADAARQLKLDYGTLYSWLWAHGLTEEVGKDLRQSTA